MGLVWKAGWVFVVNEGAWEKVGRGRASEVYGEVNVVYMTNEQRLSKRMGRNDLQFADISTILISRYVATDSQCNCFVRSKCETSSSS
jgi:predicted house-cleaning NTP pyrophosphatase (Maf/HAM1 superfamily)